MKRYLVAVLIFASCILLTWAMARGTENFDEEEQLLHREKRAKSKWNKVKPDAHKLKCPNGTWADLVADEGETTSFHVTCAVCPPDSYSAGPGLHMSCVLCDTKSGSLPGTTTALYRLKCYKKCAPGKRWDGKLPAKAMGKATCPPCAPGYYHDEYNFDTKCKHCPLFFTSKKGAKRCRKACPKGFQPSEDNSTCLHCPSGYFKSTVGNTMCIKCPGNGKKWDWTYTVGAYKSKGECFTTENKKANATPCFSYLAAALAKAGPFIYADEAGKSMRPLEEALSTSGADMAELKSQASICSELQVKIGKTLMPALPTLRFNATFSIHIPAAFYNPTTTTSSTTTSTTSSTTSSTATTPSTSTSSTTSSTSTSTTATTPYDDDDDSPDTD